MQNCVEENHPRTEVRRYNGENHTRREMLVPIAAAIASRPDQHLTGGFDIVRKADEVVKEILSRYPVWSEQ